MGIKSAALYTMRVYDARLRDTERMVIEVEVRLDPPSGAWPELLEPAARRLAHTLAPILKQVQDRGVTTPPLVVVIDTPWRVQRKLFDLVLEQGGFAIATPHCDNDAVFMIEASPDPEETKFAVIAPSDIVRIREFPQGLSTNP